MTFSSKEFCPTPYPNCTTYINLYKREAEGAGERRENNARGVYVVQNPKGVGQNKNTQLQEEKVAIITNAIQQLMADNQKITIRKIQELSGVAKATVEKHYKTILSQISPDIASDNKTATIEDKVSEMAAKEAMLEQKKLRLEERFKAVVDGQMIVPDLQRVLGYKTTNKIPLESWPKLIRGVNQDGFERFWGNLQNYKGLSL
jgi:hypothetical protein